jgi:hypothetical protein
MHTERDLDREKTLITDLDLVRICKLKKNSFDAIYAVIGSIQECKLLEELVWTNSENEPVTTFCADCLKNDHVPFYRIEWRFQFWEYCPFHLKALKRACPNCGKAISLNKTILASTRPILNLAYCQFCFSIMTDSKMEMELEYDGVKQRTHIQNNMMSSILNGYCQIAPWQQKYSLRMMILLFQEGYLLPANRSDFNKIGSPNSIETKDIRKTERRLAMRNVEKQSGNLHFDRDRYALIPVGFPRKLPA